MTGAPYPHPTLVPGSNAIGQFAIGISPIGTISTFDPWLTILSQYANSPKLTDLILSFNAAVDQTQNIDSVYDMIWNIQSAQGYGLDVWGRIVGVGRAISIPGSSDNFGFNEANSWTGFGQGNFYRGGGLDTNYLLLDPDYRRLILAKAASNICDGFIPTINQILLNLFPGRGRCYVVDGLDMTMTYKFEFTLSAIEVAIVQSSGVLPEPCGVVISIVHA